MPASSCLPVFFVRHGGTVPRAEFRKLAHRKPVFLVEPRKFEPVLMLRRGNGRVTGRPEHAQRGVPIACHLAHLCLKRAKLDHRAPRKQLHRGFCLILTSGRRAASRIRPSCDPTRRSLRNNAAKPDADLLHACRASYRDRVAAARAQTGCADDGSRSDPDVPKTADQAKRAAVPQTYSYSPPAGSRRSGATLQVECYNCVAVWAVKGIFFLACL